MNMQIHDLCENRECKNVKSFHLVFGFLLNPAWPKAEASTWMSSSSLSASSKAAATFGAIMGSSYSLVVRVGKSSSSIKIFSA